MDRSSICLQPRRAARLRWGQEASRLLRAAQASSCAIAAGAAVLVSVLLIGCAAGPHDVLVRLQRVAVPTARAATGACLTIATTRMSSADTPAELNDAKAWGDECLDTVDAAYTAARSAVNAAMDAHERFKSGMTVEADALAALITAEQAVSTLRTTLLDIGVLSPVTAGGRAP